MTAPRKRSFQENSQVFSGSFGSFLDFAAVTGAFGSVGGGGVTGSGYRPPPTPIPTVVVEAPRPKPTPTISSPPIDDPIDFGDNDPSNFPPFVDPNEPIIQPQEPGSAEPPEDDVGEPEDLPTVVVEAPRPPVAPPLIAGFGDASFPFAAAPAPAPRRPARRPARRRPKPTRRGRPLRTPARPAPRIPIAVPPMPEVKVTARWTPYAVLLTLVDPYLRMLGRVDNYGTRHSFDRMFPPIPGKRDERKPSDNPRPGSADPDALGVPDDLGQPLDEVVVSAPRPPEFPAPAPLPGVSLKPGFRIYPEVPVNPFRPPAQRPRKPRVRINPDFGLPVGAPNVLPRPFANPFVAPRNRPVPKPAPAPTPGPGSPSTPIFTPADPIDSAVPIGAPRLDPLPEPQPVPVEDPCREQRRKARKQRKPRAECWKGSYIENAKGTKKTRRTRVSCATGAELASGPKSTGDTRRRPRYNKPKIPGGLPLPDSWEIPRS